MASGLIRPVAVIESAVAFMGLGGVARCYFRLSVGQKNGRPVNIEDHSQLAFAGAVNLFLVLGLDLVRRGFCGSTESP